MQAPVSPEAVKEAAAVSPLKFLPPNTQVQRKGLRGWMAQCPFHNDRAPSMSITQGEDGRYRWKCHGCDEAGDTITLVQMTRNMSFVEAVKLCAETAKNAPFKPQMVCAYDYLDESGKLLYQVVRYDPKSFKVRTPLPNGEWCWRKPPRLVPYRLYDLTRNVTHSDIVFLVEGEKDSDKLAQQGAWSTTWPFGAKAWSDEYAKPLKELQVVVVPDMDEAGKAVGRQAYAAIEPLAARIGHVLLSVGKDVSEYFDAGKTLDDLKSEIIWKE